MRRCILAILLALSPLAAQAGDLKPSQAHSIELNSVHGVAYYTVENGEYRVVALLAASEGGIPVRVATTLTPGQRITVAVPGAVGAREAVVEIVRDGDTVAVSPIVVALN